MRFGQSGNLRSPFVTPSLPLGYEHYKTLDENWKRKKKNCRTSFGSFDDRFLSVVAVSPSKQPLLQILHERIRRFADERENQDADHDDLGLRKLARVHNEVADPFARAQQLRDDEAEPGDAER